LRTSDGFTTRLTASNYALAGHRRKRIHPKATHIGAVPDKAGLVKIQTIAVIVYLIKINAVVTYHLTHTGLAIRDTHFTDIFCCGINHENLHGTLQSMALFQHAIRG